MIERRKEWTAGLPLEEAAQVRANIMLIGANATEEECAAEYARALALEKTIRKENENEAIWR